MDRKLGRARFAAALVALTAGCFPSYVFPGDVDGGGSDGAPPVDASLVDRETPGDSAAADGDDATGTNDAAPETGTDAARPVSLQDCVLLLHMDEAAWGSPGAVKDTSGSGNHGSATGSAVTTSAGKFGGAALLDGAGWVTVPDSASLRATTNALTVTAWIFPTGLTDGTASPGIVSKRKAFGQNVAYTLFLWTNNEAWVDIQATRYSSDFVFSNGQWTHVAVVFEGAATDLARRTRIYVNGVLNKTSTADPSLAPNTEDLLIGNLPGGGNMFVGRIDEVAVWNRVLSDAELAALGTATRPL